MLKVVGWKLQLKPRSKCEGADPANLSKRYAFLVYATDDRAYCWNGSAWSKEDEPMFTFTSEFPQESDGWHHDRIDAHRRSGMTEPPLNRFGIGVVEVPSGWEFPIMVGARCDVETGWWKSKDRRPS